MGQLVLLVVAAAWAAVLIPPLLRSRIENRPNSSVTDFRNQLSSLQRAMPPRGVAMRSMSRPLAPSPLSRPAATGRPPVRSGVRTHNQGRSAGHHPSTRAGRAEVSRLYDATPRARSHGGRPAPDVRPVRRPAPPRSIPVNARDAVKRRRANVLFVLALVSGCALFLAATTKAQAMLWVFAVTFVALCGYVYVLGQLRQRERFAESAAAPPVRAATPRPDRRRLAAVPRQQPADRWSHAV